MFDKKNLVNVWPPARLNPGFVPDLVDICKNIREEKKRRNDKERFTSNKRVSGPQGFSVENRETMT